MPDQDLDEGSEMLTGVELIDWKELGFPQVPELFARLQSQDERVRNGAYGDLEWDVIYSGVSFEDIDRGYGADGVFATEVHYYVVPFLIALLPQSPPTIQEDLLRLLAETASFVYSLKDAEGIFLERAAHVHQIIWGGFETYLQILQSEDEPLVVPAARLFCKYPEHFIQIFPILMNRISKISGDTYYGQILWSIYQVLQAKGEMPAEFSLLLHQLIHETQRPKTQTTAAICLVDNLKISAPKLAIDLVTQFVTDLDMPGGRMIVPGYAVARAILNQL